jgi:hypothetical protein
MNELRVYFSSAALIASTCVLLAMAGAVAAQAVPVTHEEPLFYTQSSTVWRRGKRNPENLVLERRR